MQVSHEAQMLTQLPPGPQVWHRVASQVFWQTPPTQVWHWAALQAVQAPLTQL